MSERSTQFSPCRRYRYTLWRQWDMQHDLVASQGGYDDSDKYLMVIGLNPSTADETKDDPTIRRCKDFAMRFGFGALCMTNLFAWRDTLPKNMKLAKEPVGEMNDARLMECAAGAGMVLAAWGAHGNHLDRAGRVLRSLALAKIQVHALRINKDGSPQHPLYIPADTIPIPFPK